MASKLIDVSIIIPCYNQGQWLTEAVASALAQDYEYIEIILINDGSSDPVTNRIFQEINDARITKIATPNQGLAAARNEGIEAAKGQFILPLDADDRIAPSYIRKALSILKAYPDTGIVYCRAELFGEEQGVWEIEDYSFPEILLSPQIFASSLFRKSDWERVGGFKTDMIFGWEDYDFWLALIGLGLHVHRIDEILFYYRKTSGSMAGLDRNKIRYSFKKLFEHHKDLYLNNIEILFDTIVDTKPFRDQRIERGTFEVYIPDAENGYTGLNIRRQYYPLGVWARVAVYVNDIPEGGPHHIRVDPSVRPGLVDLASIRLLDASNSRVLWDLCQHQDGARSLIPGKGTFLIPHDRSVRLLATTDDGHFFLPQFPRSLLEKPLVVEVWIRHYLNLGPLEHFLSARITELRSESEFRSLQAHCKQLESDVHCLHGEIAALQAHSAELLRLNELAQTRVNRAQTELQESRVTVRLKELEIGEKRGLVDSKDSKIISLNIELQTLKAQVRMLHSELEQKKKPRVLKWISFKK